MVTCECWSCCWATVFRWMLWTTTAGSHFTVPCAGDRYLPHSCSCWSCFTVFYCYFCQFLSLVMKCFPYEAYQVPYEAYQDCCIRFLQAKCDCHYRCITSSVRQMCRICPRITTCMENLEMSGILTAVNEMSGILLKLREVSGKKILLGEKRLKLLLLLLLLLLLATATATNYY